MPSSSSALADRIAEACLHAYNKLGPKGKPRLRQDGVREWSVLAGFVLLDTQSDHVEVLSLGTGIKCLPADKLPLYGDILHDSHAEIIARRGLLLWMYEQLDSIYSHDNGTSDYIEASGVADRQFRLKSTVRLAMYISTLPCGDASTKLLARLQDPEVAAAFVEDQPVVSSGLSRGRQGFHTQSALRTKPARADAVSTTSLSCSDKLASYSVLGVQGALLSRFMELLYVHTYVFSGVPEDDREDIRLECERALFGRLGDLQDLPVPFHLSKPDILFTDLVYSHAKQDVSTWPADKQTGCHESLSWVKDIGVEVISQGVKHGAPVKLGFPQRSKARSRICRLALYQAWHDLCQAGNPSLIGLEPGDLLSYKQAKNRAVAYQKTKAALRDIPDAPFASWPVNDQKYQSFSLDQA